MIAKYILSHFQLPYLSFRKYINHIQSEILPTGIKIYYKWTISISKFSEYKSGIGENNSDHVLSIYLRDLYQNTSSFMCHQCHISELD